MAVFNAEIMTLLPIMSLRLIENLAVDVLNLPLAPLDELLLVHAAERSLLLVDLLVSI